MPPEGMPSHDDREREAHEAERARKIAEHETARAALMRESEAQRAFEELAAAGATDVERSAAESALAHARAESHAALTAAGGSEGDSRSAKTSKKKDGAMGTAVKVAAIGGVAGAGIGFSLAKSIAAGAGWLKDQWEGMLDGAALFDWMKVSGGSNKKHEKPKAKAKPDAGAKHH